MKASHLRVSHGATTSLRGEGTPARHASRPQVRAAATHGRRRDAVRAQRSAGTSGVGAVGGVLIVLSREAGGAPDGAEERVRESRRPQQQREGEQQRERVVRLQEARVEANAQQGGRHHCGELLRFLLQGM